MPNDGFFVYKFLTDDTAGLGDDTADDGNGFVQKTAVSGVVVIPEYFQNHRITEIMWHATRYCNSITKIKLPKTLTTINDASLTTMNGLKEIIIPASVTEIKERCDCFENLKRFVFEPGSRLKTIGECFLQYSKKLTELVLPSTVTSIGAFFLCSCANIRVVSYCGTADLSGMTDAFSGCNNYQSVIVSREYPKDLFGSKSVTVKDFSQCFLQGKKITCMCNKNQHSFGPSVVLYLLIAT